MPYQEISDARVAAYAPVAARLLRDFRDGSRAVARHTFHGPFAALIPLQKSFGDPNTGVDPPTVYFAIDTFQIDVPPGIAEGVALLSCWVDLLVGGTGGTGSKLYHRFSDGTVATVPIVMTVGFPATPTRVDWVGAIGAPGMKTWTWQAGFYIPTPAVLSAGVRHTADEHGSYLEEDRP